MTISKPNITDLFKDLLAEIEGFKYQITLKVLLSKYKENAEREFAPVNFSFTAKTLVGFEDSHDRSFQEVFNRIDNWISEGSGWVIEYVNVSIYSPLSVISYIELPDRLRNSKKGLINIKNDGNKCFLWCHIWHLNPLKKHLERTTKVHRQMVNGLDYDGVRFPVSKKYYSKIEKKNSICINVFGYENGLVYPVHVSDKKTA